jgi:hypothetical protein
MWTIFADLSAMLIAAAVWPQVGFALSAFLFP